VQLVETMDQFVKSASTNLIAISSSLLNYGGSGVLRELKKRKDGKLNTLDSTLTKLSAAKQTKYSLEAGVNTAAFKKRLIEGDNISKEAACEDLKNKIGALANEIRRAEVDVVHHRDTHEEVYGCFLIFCWRERTIHHDNGERVYLESLRSERDQLQALLCRLQGNSVCEELALTETELELSKLQWERDETRLNAEIKDINVSMDDLFKKNELENIDAVIAIKKLTRGVNNFDKVLAES